LFFLTKNPCISVYAQERHAEADLEITGGLKTILEKPVMLTAKRSGGKGKKPSQTRIAFV